MENTKTKITTKHFVHILEEISKTLDNATLMPVILTIDKAVDEIHESDNPVLLSSLIRQLLIDTMYNTEDSCAHDKGRAEIEIRSTLENLRDCVSSIESQLDDLEIDINNVCDTE